MTAQTTKAIGWKDDLTPQKPSKKKGLSQQIQEPSLDRFVTDITDLFYLKTLLELMIWIHKMIESDTAFWQKICDKNNITPGFSAFLCRS